MPADEFEDFGDGLSRLGKHLLRDRETLVEAILCGALAHDEYVGKCERVQQIDSTLELIVQVRRGEDRRNPPSGPSLNVEE